jgi:hypothetical protein
MAPKSRVRIATTVMELVLLYRFLGERRNLFFGLSLVFRESPPFANDFSARIVVCFHVRSSLVRPAVTYGLHAARPIGPTYAVFLPYAPI